MMAKPTRGAKVTVACAFCGKPFQAREADIRRGWGKYDTKSCKASAQAEKQRYLTTVCPNNNEEATSQ